MNKLLGRLVCFLYSIYYWFRFPTGDYVTGHDFSLIKESSTDLIHGDLKCDRCGYISRRDYK